MIYKRKIEHRCPILGDPLHSMFAESRFPILAVVFRHKIPSATVRVFITLSHYGCLFCHKIPSACNSWGIHQSYSVTRFHRPASGSLSLPRTFTACIVSSSPFKAYHLTRDLAVLTKPSSTPDHLPKDAKLPTRNPP